tara:strand:- start:204 stop:599 length:396 start_codon:yes stop_codon:yes gene_type:complete
MTDQKINKRTLKEFGVLIGIGIPLMFGFIMPFITGHPPRTNFIYFGILSLILSIVAPKFLLYPYKIWMKLGFILGWINSKLILGLIFITILLPISLIMRMTGYDPLRFKKTNLDSYREITKNKIINFEKLF